MRRVLATLAIAVVTISCAGPSGSAVKSSGAIGSSAGSPATGASPSSGFSPPAGAVSIRDGTLKSGTTYATSHFAVPFTVTIPSDTPDRFWFASSTTLMRALEIGNPEIEGSGIGWYLPTGGFDADGNPAAAPADFVQWIEDDPQISASRPRSVTLGGRAATQIDVAAIPERIPVQPSLCPVQDHCVVVASTDPDAPLRPLLIFPGLPQRIIVVELDTGPLLIDIQPGVVRQQAERLIASMQFFS